MEYITPLYLEVFRVIMEILATQKQMYMLLILMSEILILV